MGVCAVGAATFAAFVLVWNLRERAQHRKLAATRASLTAKQFVAALVQRGVAHGTAEYVHAQIAFYYFAPLTPLPDDDLLRLIKIDPDDISDDVIAYARKFAFKLPDHHVEWPDPLTATSYAFWLDGLRGAG